MSLSKLIKITLYKEKITILLYLCAYLSINLFYYLLYDSKIYFYPLIINIFFILIYLIYKSLGYKNLLLYLNESKTSPCYKGAENSEFEYIFNEINEIHDNYISKIYDIENKEKEREHLLIEWIHNMKTSVSVISLALEKIPYDDAVDDIKNENELLKKNLEGALNIFRLNDFTKDYIIEPLNLKSLVKEAVNSQKNNFIYSNVFPMVDISEDLFILSDKKWGRYVLIQVISNAIKYSKRGSKVFISAEKQGDRIKINIRDTGIGIKDYEIKKIFDPFFTGSNGRDNEKSSGIGLYMCKNICESLKESIEVKSKFGEGTVVSITYLEYKNLTTM